MNVAFEAYGGRSPGNFPQFPGVLAGPGFLTTGGGLPLIVADDFGLHSNTNAPSLGTPVSILPTSSTPWTIYGPTVNGELGPAVGGRIQDGFYVADVGQVVYAVRRALQPVRSVRSIVAFGDGGYAGGSPTYGTTTMIISSESDERKCIQNCIHLVATRVGVSIEKIVNKTITSVGGFSFPSSNTYIPKDGATLIPFSFDLDEAGNWACTYAGRTISGTDADFPALAGTVVCAEIYNLVSATLDSTAKFKKVAFSTSSALANIGKTIILNGNYDTDTLWTKGTAWTISGGVAVHNGGAGNLSPATPVPAIVAQQYLVPYTLTPSGFTTTMQMTFGGATGAVRSGQGTYCDALTAVDTSSLVIAATSGLGFVNEIAVVPVNY